MAQQTIDLTEKQLQILANIHQQKASLEQSFKQLAEKENDVVLAILEAKGVKISETTKVSYGEKSIIVDDGSEELEKELKALIKEKKKK